MHISALQKCSFCIMISDEQNRRKGLRTNKANGKQKSLGDLKGAKTIAR